MYVVWFPAGSIPEKGDGGLYNTCTVFNPAGEMVAKHRKVPYTCAIYGEITVIDIYCTMTFGHLNLSVYSRTSLCVTTSQLRPHLSNTKFARLRTSQLRPVWASPVGGINSEVPFILWWYTVSTHMVSIAPLLSLLM